MEPASEPATKRASGPSLRQLIWWTVWLCLASWMLIRIPTEVSYWLLALAEQASQAGHNEEALQWIEKAKQWTPESALPYERQAQVLLKEKKANPLAAIDKMLASNPPNAMKARLHLVKSEILKEREEYKAALREFDDAANFQVELRPSLNRLELLLLAGDTEQAKRELAQVSEQLAKKEVDNPISDNTIAYFSALLGENLEEALSRANQALSQQKDEPAILDTRGYILHRLGRNEEALADLQRAVEKLDEQFPTPPRDRTARKNIAVILYHRSLVLNALEKSAEAEQDRARVRDLGFEPNERLF